LVIKILKCPKRGHKIPLLQICNWINNYLRIKKPMVISIVGSIVDYGEYIWYDKHESEYGPCHFITINKKTLNPKSTIGFVCVLIHEMYHAYQYENKMKSSEYNASMSEQHINKKLYVDHMIISKMMRRNCDKE